jgi:uncharacterized repeat protein (TIGR01451 family)
MRLPRTALLLVVALAGGLLVAEEPRDAKRMPARRVEDPDADEAVRPAQHVVPADLPGEVTGGPVILPATYTEPGGELPVPSVTLNIEGTDVTATGQPVVYKLHVQNNSGAKAHNVVVTVTQPKGATKVKAEPPPAAGADNRWEFKILGPGQSKTIDLAYQPNQGASEVQIQARVQFDYGRGMITKVSAPSLSVKSEAPSVAIVGDALTYKITVTNTGSVTIKDIEVRELLTKGLVYDERETGRGMVDGRLTSSVDVKAGERKWSIPLLAPGKSETLYCRVKVREAGQAKSTVTVSSRSAPDLVKETSVDTEVLTALLQLHAEGPADGKGTVDQPARYKVVVSNHGSADLKNVVVRCLYSSDLKPRAATNGGERFKDTVQWTFKDLRKGDVKELNVSLATTSPGLRTIRFSARAEKGDEQKTEVKTEFAGLPSLDWDVQAPGVAAVGKPITYKVTISNRGTALGRARLQVDLPPTLDLRDSTPKAGQGFGQNAKEVRFQQYDFPAGKKTTFTIVVDAKSSGEAKTIFSLYEEGRPEKQESKVTNVTGTDSRSPSGPPPAKGVDRTKVGYDNQP